MLTNVLIIIGGLILIIALLSKFWYVNHGTVGISIIMAIIASVIPAYQKNTNGNWIDIGASAIKIFMTIALLIIVMGFLIYGIFHIKEEMSEWMNNRRK